MSLKITLCAILLLLGQSPAPPRFDIASVKLNASPGDNVVTGGVTILPGGRLRASAAIPRFLIQRAYGVRPEQISGGPAWMEDTHYDIDAKAADNATQEQVLKMLQSLLEERFKLKVHRETRQLTVYDLTVAKNGIKLPQAKNVGCVPVDSAKPGLGLEPGARPCGRVFANIGPIGTLFGDSVTMPALIFTLSNVLGRTIIDKTSFTGTFDINMKFAADEAIAMQAPRPSPNAPPRTADPGPSIFTAMQNELGLRLESTKGPVEVIVIEHIEKPSTN